jgi:hypothetical protein
VVASEQIFPQRLIMATKVNLFFGSGKKIIKKGDLEEIIHI